jgi:dTDP-4-dehydrorhamnose reductase
MLSRYLAREHEVFGTSDNCEPDRTHFLCDLRQPKTVAALAEQIQPDVVIHAAGVKDIAFCEKNYEAAMAINCQTTVNLARVFGEISRIVYISTDYVFDGQRGNYNEQDSPLPATHYGQSKLAGEREGLLAAPDNFEIVRTAALYDLQATFLKFLFGKLSSGETIECFSDTIYSPTYYADFLAVVEKVAQDTGEQKIYHACGQSTSRYAFALCFAEAFGFDTHLVEPCSYQEKGLSLFPNLSLNGRNTQAALDIRVCSHRQALCELACQPVGK